MIYKVKAILELDTRTNKVVIEADKHRIVLFPGPKIAEHWVDVIADDRSQGSFSYAKDICKFLVQSLHGRKQIPQLAKEHEPYIWLVDSQGTVHFPGKDPKANMTYCRRSAKRMKGSNDGNLFLDCEACRDLRKQEESSG